jgi:hypothetical protein
MCTCAKSDANLVTSVVNRLYSASYKQTKKSQQEFKYAETLDHVVFRLLQAQAAHATAVTTIN